MSDLTETAEADAPAPTPPRFPNVAIKKIRKIGLQTLILGDCLEVMQTFPAVAFDHIICDPPYEQAMQDKMNARAGMKTNAEQKRGNTSFSWLQRSTLAFEGVDAIRPDFLVEARRITNSWVICFCTVEGVARWADEMERAGVKYRGGHAWYKPDYLPNLNGHCPAFCMEFMAMGWCDRRMSTWNRGGESVFYTSAKEADRDGRHPTQKPVIIMKNLLRDFANIQKLEAGDMETVLDETVLDPFMGSGTTLVACQQMGIRGTGIELNEEFFNIACERVLKQTKSKDLLIRRAPRQAKAFLDPALFPKVKRRDKKNDKADIKKLTKAT